MNRKNIWMALFGTVGLFGLNMGFLGVHGGGHADHGRDECSLFGMKPRKKVTEEIKNA